MKKAFYLCLLLILFGCIDEINFNTANSSPTFLTVDGLLSTSGRQVLRLFRINSLKIGDAVPVNTASVSVLDENGLRFDYQLVEDGIYELPEGVFTSQPGKGYHLEIILENKVYHSSAQIMPKLAPADSIYQKFEIEVIDTGNGVFTEEKVINIYLDTSIPQDGNYYLRWTVNELYSFSEIPCGLDPTFTCYIRKRQNTNPQLIQLASNEGNNLQRIDELKVATKRNLISANGEFRERHYFSAYQYSTTREAYEYWQQVEKVTAQVGSIFDEPPASIKGNIFNIDDEEEVVLGYFEVAAIDTVRTFILASDFMGFVVLPNFCGQSLENARKCCNCLLIDGASHDRPDWF